MSSDDKYKIFDSESGRRFAVTTDAVVILERRFSFREVALALLCCLLALLVLVFFGIVMHDRAASDTLSHGASAAAQRGAAPEPCKSKHCVMAAAAFVEHMNQSADPCQDFHEFSCGGTAEHDHSRGWWRSSTVYSKLQRRNRLKLVHILLTETRRKHLSSAERKLKHLFYSCRNEFARGRLGGRPFVDKVLKPLGRVFLLGDTNFTGWSLNQELQKVHTDFWTDAIFTLRIDPDPADPEDMIMQLRPGGLGLSSTYSYISNYWNQSRVVYRTFITKIANLLIRDAEVNFNESHRNQIVSQFVDDVISFETKLANETIRTYRKTFTTHPSMSAKTLGYLNQNAAPINWIDYFRYLFDDRRINTGPTTEVISNNWHYILNAMSMIRRLRKEKGDEITWRILHNYFVWRMAHDHARYLSFEYVHAEKVFDRATFRRRTFLSTFGYCYQLVKNAMPEALGALFVRDHFADSSLDDIKVIIDRLKAELKASLKKSSWMDSVTGKRAAEKLSAAVDKVGYPGYAFRDSELDTIFRSGSDHEYRISQLLHI